jgi:hypothetical protein
MLRALLSTFGFTVPSAPVVIEEDNRVLNFLAELNTVAPSGDYGSFGFPHPGGGFRGWVQFIVDSPKQVTIHRLWTLSPGKGHGKHMLGIVCELADRHSVLLKLKVLPIGRKPYPRSRQQLHDWYQSFGFEGTVKKMMRFPRCPVAAKPQPISKGAWPETPVESASVSGRIAKDQHAFASAVA